MQEVYTEPQWLEIVQQQEQALRFERFSREDALSIGLEIIRLAKEVYHKSAAVYVVEDDVLIFSYKMPRTSLENDWWMRKKLNVSKRTGVSSLLSLLEARAGLRPAVWESGDEGSFAACGGCFPVHRTEGVDNAYILVSGMAHEEDHQIMVDAISRHLGVAVGTIVNR